MTVYIASRTKHAAWWRHLRAEGHHIISTWIDEAEAGQSPDLADLASRCIAEAAAADRTIIYGERGDTLKGALIEVGAALAHGREVVSVGQWDNYQTALMNHPNWRTAPTVEKALSLPPFAAVAAGRGAR